MPGKIKNSEEERKNVFQQIRSLLKTYHPPLVAKIDDEYRFDLWSMGEFEVEGRKKKEIFFASVIIYKSYVGFYFMPVYTEADIKRFFGAELLSRLKGKSCFHLKRLDALLEWQIEEALKMGYQLYLQKGWIKEEKLHAG